MDTTVAATAHRTTAPTSTRRQRLRTAAARKRGGKEKHVSALMEYLLVRYQLRDEPGAETPAPVDLPPVSTNSCLANA